jgi:hypothetical protein
MAFTASFTAKRGQVQLKDVAIGAGSAEAQSDTMTLHVDVTNMTKGDAIILAEAILQKIHATNWPPA